MRYQLNENLSQQFPLNLPFPRPAHHDPKTAKRREISVHMYDTNIQQTAKYVLESSVGGEKEERKARDESEVRVFWKIFIQFLKWKCCARELESYEYVGFKLEV